MNKKILGVLAVSLLISHPVYALTRKQVAACALFWGGVAATGVYSSNLPSKWLWPWSPKESFVCDPNEDTSYLKKYVADSNLWGGLTLATTTPLLGWILSYWTPKSRYRWAHRKLDNLESQSMFLVTMHDGTIQQILQDAGCEATGLPLVTAFLQLKRHDETLCSIERHLIQALEDAGQHSYWGKKVKTLLRIVQEHLKRVRSNEQFVKQYDQAAWLEQWKIHQKRELERERLNNQLAQIHGHVVYNI